MISAVVQVAMSRSYLQMRPLAMGVTAVGISVSQVMGPPLLTVLMGHYNLQTTLLVTGIIMLHLCFAATLLPSDPACGSAKQTSYMLVLRRRGVPVLCLMMAFIFASLNISWATIPLSLFASGHSPHEVSLYLSAAGLANLAARVAASLLQGHYCRPLIILRFGVAMATVAIFGEYLIYYLSLCAWSPVPSLHPRWMFLT